MPFRSGILLIGGGGFFGLALARALVARQKEVHVLSRGVESGRRAGIAFHRGSQDDPAVVQPLLERCGLLIHLAATTTPGSSRGTPVIDTLENLLPAARLMDMLSRIPPKRIIFISSGGAIYGNPSRLPVDESHPTAPLSYHAAGKVSLESLMIAFAHVNPVQLAILRPSNLYGPGQTLRAGFGLIRTLLDKAWHGTPVDIWGDGSAVRDYLYIDDAVDACRRLIDSADASGIFNLGSGIGVSIADLIPRVEQITGRTLQVVAQPERGIDVRTIVLDCARLQRATGWVPRIGLDDGLRHTWNWVCEQHAEQSPGSPASQSIANQHQSGGG